MYVLNKPKCKWLNKFIYVCAYIYVYKYSYI